MNAEKKEWTVLVKGIGVKPFFLLLAFIYGCDRNCTCALSATANEMEFCLAV